MRHYVSYSLGVPLSSRRVVGFIVALVLSMGSLVALSPSVVLAGDGVDRCSTPVGRVGGSTCASRADGQFPPSHGARRTSFDGGAMLNVTMTGIRCNGLGRNCNGARQEFYERVFSTEFFSSYVFGHTWYTAAGWNDGESGLRYFRQSPLVA